MNRSLERAGLLFGVLILLASLQFGAALAGAAAALVAALLLSAGATWLWVHFELPSGAIWVPPVVCAVLCETVAALLDVTLHPTFFGLFAFLPAALGSGLTLFLLRRSEARCGLCNRSLSASALVFACPRCSMHVCDETCWSFEHGRCQLCLDQRVPLLPMEESWWMRVAGPRSRHDRCQVCRGAADQVDLRLCPHCRRAQCRDCWDFTNGECQRCRTALPDLPASLQHTVASTVSAD